MGLDFFIYKSIYSDNAESQPQIQVRLKFKSLLGETGAPTTLAAQANLDSLHILPSALACLPCPKEGKQMPLSMATSQIQMEKWLGMPVRAFKQAKNCI